MSPIDPWPYLSRVRDFTIRIYHPGTGQPRLSHEGNGVVQVEPCSDAGEERVAWQESGCWSGGPLAGISFHTSTLWRRREGMEGLELSHLRRGPAHPTLLVELRPAADHSAWLSTAPHLCGLDRYSARLTCEADVLQLLWEVESPTDPYLLEWTGHPG